MDKIGRFARASGVGFKKYFSLSPFQHNKKCPKKQLQSILFIPNQLGVAQAIILILAKRLSGPAHCFIPSCPGIGIALSCYYGTSRSVPMPTTI
jgi:hypothetical protein